MTIIHIFLIFMFGLFQPYCMVENAELAERVEWCQELLAVEDIETENKESNERGMEDNLDVIRFIDLPNRVELKLDEFLITNINKIIITFKTVDKPPPNC